MHNCRIYSSISEINKESWDELANNNIFMCYAWLKTFEETAKDLPFPYYIVLEDNHKIVAASVCYFEIKRKNLSGIDKILLGRFEKLYPIKNFSLLPALMCGSKRGYGTHFLFSNHLAEEERLKLEEELVKIVEEIALKQNSALYFSNILSSEPSLIQLLLERGYLKTMGLPLNYMDITWSSFQQYKKQIVNEHPSMKKTISREINKNKKSGVTIKLLQDVNGESKKLFELLEMNFKKYNESEFFLKPDFFCTVKNNFNNNALIYAAFKDENLIGVSLQLVKDKTSALTYVGIDHNRSKDDLTYFNITFYEPVKRSIAYGLHKIYGGNAYYKMKARRGFKAAKTFIFYKPASTSFILLVKSWFFIHRSWMSRKFSYLKMSD